MLQAGFHDVPAGHIAAVVTHLEMRAAAPVRSGAGAEGLSLLRIEEPDPDWYRALFLRVGGQDWLWFSRLLLDDDALADILEDADVHVYVLRRDGLDIGLMELDFRQPGACELAFFGLVSSAIGTGAGRFMMNEAIRLAWAAPISLFHVHTCTMDSPQALDFYQRSGFVPVRRQVEVVPDPRLSGLLPETAAPHVPILK
ncbi:hypothetical protein EV656_103246 [Rhodovulum adriaticum]|uniref:N-acetyltransferase domain-containing protein n=2 Tax=Rhodovulum adriaticum TaxID=35804 RepID=A0A4R2NVC3_RHOAD|nr:GNAT family N-acetyltransferase [Rhodovulum adriaticum]MBK1636178.1 GNAT family N-acetyltransferase [Rhodovulum adriaticum]TCP25494.1 hypothetical protein EV656_103246 [Rhodovulum adriaticum]